MGSVLKITLGVALGLLLFLATCTSFALWPNMEGSSSSDYVSPSEEYADSVRVEPQGIRDAYGGSRYAVAEIENLSSRSFTEVAVRFNIYREGVRQRTIRDQVYDLAPGERALIEAEFFEHEGIDSTAFSELYIDL